MKRMFLVVMLFLAGCTDVRVEPDIRQGGNRMKIIEFVNHGSIGGDPIVSLIFKDTKTEKEFIVIKVPNGVTIQQDN